MPLSESLMELDAAFYARGYASAALIAAIGVDESGGANLVHGHPKELLEKPFTGMKLISWYSPYRSPQGETPRRVHITTNTWIWPDDATGGLAAMKAADDVLCALYGGGKNAVAWFDTASGLDVESRCIAVSDPPSAFRRKQRIWEISPVTG